jgi:hypothetical protein
MMPVLSYVAVVYGNDSSGCGVTLRLLMLVVLRGCNEVLYSGWWTMAQNRIITS